MNPIAVYKKAKELNQKVVVRDGYAQVSLNESTNLREFLDCLSYESLVAEDWRVVNKKTFVREGVSFKTILANHYIDGNIHLLEFFAPFIPGQMRMFGDLKNVKNAKITVEYEEE